MTVPPHENAEIAKGAAERLTFFSDAVIAIALTLLALELPLPEGETVGEAWQSLGHNYEEFLAFLISFWVIGTQWRSHHSFLTYVDRVTPAVVRLNLLWLLTIIVTPFASRALVGEVPFAMAFTLYAAIQAASALVRLALIAAIRRDALAHEATPPGFYRDALQRSAGVATTFAVSIPVAYLAGTWAYAVWIVLPVVTHGARGILARRRPTAAA